MEQVKISINLIEKYKQNGWDVELKEKFNIFKEKHGYNTETSDNLKIGDIVKFIAGYNSDILYTTEILGFDEEGNLFVLWECYWFPVRKKELL